VPCEAGLCVLTGPQGTATAGVIWRGGETPTPIPVTTPDGGGQTSVALRRLLDSFEGGAAEWRTHDGAGMLALPIAEHGRVFGQFVLEVADQAGDGRNLGRLGDLVRACAHILRRVETMRLTARRQEETGSAILQQEQVHRRAMRKARLDSVSRMAAGAAHEINNPLAVISGRAQLLLSRAADPDQVQALETIVQQSRRVSRVITDLMQFARPEAPKFAPVSLSQILHQAHLTQADRLKEAGIRVVEDYAAGLPLVEADRHQMMQVFTHLIMNSIQAMPDGGLLTLRVKAGMHTPSVVVQILDTGSGIMPEHMDHVFEPFFSGRRIVERHLGTITLQSEMGEGCVCTLRFPASAVAEVNASHFTLPRAPQPAESSPFAPPASVAKAQAAAAPVATARGRIVLCEPNEDAREVMQRTLEGRGFSAVGAHDGLEALALLFTDRADILLCDLHETALNAQPLLKQARERFPGLAIVAFTSSMSSELSRDPLRPLADACVQKPFHLETLFNALEACITPSQRAAL
jgi:signal transduction histidine kinase/ActR/RegA family two-component response regulator